MDDQQLDRALKSLGKEVFVNYFDKFSDLSSSRRYIAKTLEEDGYAKKSSRTKVSNARSIFGAGRAKDALAIIIRSSRVPPQIVARAREILDTRF